MGKLKYVAGFLIASNIIATSVCLYTCYELSVKNKNEILKNEVTRYLYLYRY